MTTVALVVLLAGLLTGGWAAAHVLYARSDRRHFRTQRTRARATAERRARDEERARRLSVVRQQFPLAAPLIDAAADEVPVRDLVSAVPGVRIGTTTEGLPVIVPHAVRTRHLCCWGRTGSGKTSLALRLVGDDLAAGRGAVVIGTERELFRDHLLPLVPAARIDDVVYFAPGDPACPVRWNPFQIEGDDRARAAAELFAVFQRALAEESPGPQSTPIVRNGLLATTGVPGATFLTLRDLLEDAAFRDRYLPTIPDPECRAWFASVFPKLARGAARPVLNRLETFVGFPGVRRALCTPAGNLALGATIDQGKILLVDLFGFDAATARLVGQMVLAFLSLALLRRERMPEAERRLCVVYADEFAELCSAGAGAVDVFRIMLSKGRRYGLSLNVFSQFPSQIDTTVRQELFGNCASVISLAVGAQEAQAIRRELLVPSEDGPPEAVPAESLVSLPIGCAYARIGGACAMPVRLDAPLAPGDVAWGEAVRDRSWARFVPTAELVPRLALAAPRVPDSEPDQAATTRAVRGNGERERAAPAVLIRGGLPSDDERYLTAVRENPGRNSSEYAKLARMSGASALKSRKRLVAAGLIREHRVATGARGRSAIVLEPVTDAARGDS